MNDVQIVDFLQLIHGKQQQNLDKHAKHLKLLDKSLKTCSSDGDGDNGDHAVLRPLHRPRHADLSYVDVSTLLKNHIFFP